MPGRPPTRALRVLRGLGEVRVSNVRWCNICTNTILLKHEDLKTRAEWLHSDEFTLAGEPLRSLEAYEAPGLTRHMAQRSVGRRDRRVLLCQSVARPGRARLGPRHLSRALQILADARTCGTQSPRICFFKKYRMLTNSVPLITRRAHNKYVF